MILSSVSESSSASRARMRSSRSDASAVASLFLASMSFLLTYRASRSALSPSILSVTEDAAADSPSILRRICLRSSRPSFRPSMYLLRSLYLRTSASRLSEMFS